MCYRLVKYKCGHHKKILLDPCPEYKFMENLGRKLLDGMFKKKGEACKQVREFVVNKKKCEKCRGNSSTEPTNDCVREEASVHTDSSHASGRTSRASGYTSHASGYSSHASGHTSHASGHSSHVSGQSSRASGHSSHASGHENSSQQQQEFSDSDGSSQHGSSSSRDVDPPQRHSEARAPWPHQIPSQSQGQHGQYAQRDHSEPRVSQRDVEQYHHYIQQGQTEPQVSPRSMEQYGWYVNQGQGHWGPQPSMEQYNQYVHQRLSAHRGANVQQGPPEQRGPYTPSEAASSPTLCGSDWQPSPYVHSPAYASLAAHLQPGQQVPSAQHGSYASQERSRQYAPDAQQQHFARHSRYTDPELPIHAGSPAPQGPPPRRGQQVPRSPSASDGRGSVQSHPYTI